MGMYTELVLKAQVKDHLPEDVEAVLQFLFNREDIPEHLPEHEFFQCPRWRFLGSSSSYNHVPFTSGCYAEGYIFSRSDLKNYNDEIGKFISWLLPYLDVTEGDCIGWTWYEEERQPTLITVPFYAGGL